MPNRQLLLSELNDEALVERVKARDVAAFTLLYDRHAPAIYALAAHLLNPADAEEIVQDAFLRLWHKADQFDAHTGLFKAWFMTIARNRIFDELKQYNQERRLLAVTEIDQLLTEAADPKVNVAEEVWRRQREDAMAAALQNLPAEQRRAIVMAYFGDFSQSAIAAELGWPLGTVKKRIRLGMQKLRGFLNQWREIVK